MTLEWVSDTPTWDADKQRLVGGADDGIFDRRYRELGLGDMAPGTWWRVTDSGQTVGYGWLDVVWGDAEILLVADKRSRGQGIGGFILDHLDAEASRRGLNYLYNTVRPTHPRAAEMTEWLTKRGFRPSEDGSLMRRVAQPASSRAR